MSKKYPQTIVYVDGFNLFYGALKNSLHKWLDLSALSSKLFPNNDIIQIKYFTAAIIAKKGDDKSYQNQKTYLRALRTLPKVKIIEGSFIENETDMFCPSLKKKITVIKREEKQTDVNLACELLCDAFFHKMKAAIIVSNDSDFVGPIKKIKLYKNMPIGVLNPRLRSTHQSIELVQVADFRRKIKEKHLKESQFPFQLKDASGKFSRPEEWGIQPPSKTAPYLKKMKKLLDK